MKRSYENALKLLEMRRRPCRPIAAAAPQASQNAALPSSNNVLRGTPSLAGMSEWLQILGHSDRDLDKLNIVHVAGTKGKGSTCAFTRSFLHAHAFHTFVKEKVDAAIFETHHGGEYDATNVIPKPVVTGVTSLGMDHISQLGPTIEDIAWHKAGIFKAGTPAFSVLQEDRPSVALSKRAAEKGVDLTFVSTNEALFDGGGVLNIPVQRLNCSLALEIARAFLKLKEPEDTIDAEDISRGIKTFSWAGRFEVIEDGISRWFLDGAHNMMSLEQAVQWFSNATNAPDSQKFRVLIFSHFSEGRDGAALAEGLAHSLSKYNAAPDCVIFTTYQESEGGSMGKDRTVKLAEPSFPEFCDLYSSIWKGLNPQGVVSCEPTIEGAIKFAKRMGALHGGMEVLVTGSLHLVGGALNILRPQD
ncbi:folylpolyglutamate synthase [Blastomyces dermatitidis ATCC 26199]|nr:folylpolyglutamate synthase [Blastomyces dermatitidis ATCC 26199]